MGGSEGDARGRRYGDICIRIADSLCYTAETNNIVKQLYSNKDVKKIIKFYKSCALTLFFFLKPYLAISLSLRIQYSVCKFLYVLMHCTVFLHGKDSVPVIIFFKSVNDSKIVENFFSSIYHTTRILS